MDKFCGIDDPEKTEKIWSLRMKERRKTKRFVEKNRAVIHFSIGKKSLTKNPDSAWTRNLSIDGAKLITHRFFPIDTRLIISLELPKSKQLVKLWARVIWVERSKDKRFYDVGVEFIHSLETVPNLLQHLYGFGTCRERIASSPRKRIFPVDVSEV